MVEGARLESVYTGNGIAGSNPALSACHIIHTFLRVFTFGNYYYGSTDDAEKRLAQHNAGKVRYTKGRRPWIIHYIEEFDSRSDAVKREQFL